MGLKENVIRIFLVLFIPVCHAAGDDEQLNYKLGNGEHSLPESPNVLIFIVDDLGIGDIGCYGNDTIKTPNIDSIAQQGVKFEHNLAPENLCTPSRAASLTGRYAVRSGLTSTSYQDAPVIISTACSGGLPENETTYGRIFQTRGYKTGYFGKWHLGIHKKEKDYLHHPLNHGFDYYYGMPLSNTNEFGKSNDFGPETGSLCMTYFFPYFYVKPEIVSTFIYISIFNLILVLLSSFGRGLKQFLTFIFLCTIIICGVNLAILKLLNNINAIVMRNKDVVEQPVHLPTLTKRLTAEAENYIKTHAHTPFLAVVAYHKVHIALAVDEGFRDKSVHGLYGDSVEEVDWSVGNIMAALKENNLLNNTFVYFTSDHGPAKYAVINGEMHGGWAGVFRGGKGSNLEGGIRVPTVAMWPGVIPSNLIYDKPTSGLDLFPSLMKVVGAPLPHDRIIDGVEFFQKMSPSYENEGDRFFFHYCGPVLTAVTYQEVNSKVVWKIHYQIPEKSSCFGDRLKAPLLFNLLTDKSEREPLRETDNVYQTVVGKINEGVMKHQASISYVEGQLSPEKQKPSLSLVTCCKYPWSYCRENV